MKLAAPRERGWTLAAELIQVAVRGCPARAGMDPLASKGATLRLRLPRASGDGPAAILEATELEKAAPRERGWTRLGVLPRSRMLGCPARAGMDPPLIRAWWW